MPKDIGGDLMPYKKSKLPAASVLKFERFVIQNIREDYVLNIRTVLNLITKDMKVKDGRVSLNFEYVEKLFCSYLQKLFIIKVTNAVKNVLNNPKDLMTFEQRFDNGLKHMLEHELAGSTDLINNFKDILMEIENLYYKFNEEMSE
jgi:hypothetical protein